MMKKDYYEDLCKFYELMVGTIPDRDSFQEALIKTVAAEDLEIFFKIPTSGNILFSKLLKKSKIPDEEIRKRLENLASEGFILEYKTDKGDAYERGNPVFMSEQQVRKSQDSPQRRTYVKFFNALIDGELREAVITKTPYYRVLTAEQAISTPSELRTIDIDVALPSPGEVLPIDIITEMIKKDGALIGVADCFCRRTKKDVGEGCEYPVETCFVFNELAQTLIKHGYAREIDYEKTILILKNCEEKGLVHNVDNCSKDIRSLCNCCPCCCILLKSVKKGVTNAEAPSRYIVQFEGEKCKNCGTCISRCPTDARVSTDDRVDVDLEKCIGCGLCVTTCPNGANRMVLREKPQKILSSWRKLNEKIGKEAMVSILKKKIFGKKY